MRRPNIQRDEFASLLFGLSDKSVEFRSRWRTLAGAAVWFLLSGLTMVLFIFQMQGTLPRLAIVVMSFIKYVPLLMVVYALAKTKAARYLDDIFELNDEYLASNFIEEVAFGHGYEHITINEGKISEKEERSPIILIGGPGFVQVNLDSVALLEKVDGTPNIIHPRAHPWKLSRFERIREIGKHDEVGQREYAIINLRDQFVRGLSVKSRTKDGIPIEAQDIKVMFSILRNQNNEEVPENDPYHFDSDAVLSLVYNQIIITPPPSKTSGVSFPWDTTVIPLVTSELEDLIKSRNLSEILASISQRELDSVNKSEETNVQMRIEMTGEQTAMSRATASSKAPNFESRSKITAQFFQEAFIQKAAKLGVAIHWIDIGTWQLPSEIIFDKLKEAWGLMRENEKRRGAIERLSKKHEMDELIDLVTNVIITSFSKTTSSSSSRKLSDRELDELAKIIESNPEIAVSPYMMRSFSQQAASKKDAQTIALEILKGFRRELIAARELIQKENRSSIEKQADLARIEKALKDIDFHVFHYVKSSG